MPTCLYLVNMKTMRKASTAASTSRIIFFFLRRHSSVYLLLTVLGVVIGILEGLNLAVFIPILNNLVGVAPAEGVEDKLLVQTIGKVIGMMPVHDPFLAAASLFLALTVLKGALSLLHEYIVARSSGEVLSQYRQELIERYGQAPLSYFDHARSGALTYNLNMPPVMLSKLLYTLPRSFIDFLRFFFVMVILFYMEPSITIGVTVCGALLYFSVSKPLTRYSYRLSAHRRIAEQEMSAVATEWIRGVRPIRTAGADKHWIQSFSDANDVSRTTYVKTTFLLASPRHVFELVAFAGLFIGMIITYLSSPATLMAQVTNIGLFSMGLARVLPSFATLARTPLDIRTMLPDVENLYEIIHNLPEMEQDGAIPFTRLDDGIRLRNVSVEHAGRAKALDDVSLDIEKGKVVAFVGRSGAGKTTLLNVVIGAQSPSSGQVLYDGTPLANLNKSSLLHRIGYVGQDVLLFHGTIRQNIAYFKQDISESAIAHAADIAEIHDFVMGLPQGYDTLVGEGGVNFSGGQAQRLAIARAIVQNPDILILDEATSALDSSSEKIVVDALRRASANRTVIMVTHRLATVKWADKIHVLDGGKLAESGTWDGLLNDRSTRFYSMCSEQQVAPTE